MEQAPRHREAGWTAQLGGIVLAVIGTGLAGLWRWWLRDRSGSLLTTVIAHTATNSLADGIAWLTTN